MRISDWSSDVCSSDLQTLRGPKHEQKPIRASAPPSRRSNHLVRQPKQQRYADQQLHEIAPVAQAGRHEAQPLQLRADRSTFQRYAISMPWVLAFSTSHARLRNCRSLWNILTIGTLTILRFCRKTLHSNQRYEKIIKR